MKPKTLIISKYLGKRKTVVVAVIVLLSSVKGDNEAYINPPIAKTHNKSWKLVNGNKEYKRDHWDDDAFLPVRRFNKKKYCGEERLCKYILKYVGPGFYSVLLPKGGKTGNHSLWRGNIDTLHFRREYSKETIQLGLYPYLSSAKPIGQAHYFV